MNKKVVFVGLLGLAAFAAYSMNKKNADQSGSATAAIADRGYSATYPGAPNGATWLIYMGKKYAFVSEQAFRNFGYTQPQNLTKQDVEVFPNAGFVGDDGRVWDNLSKAVILGNSSD